MISSHGTEGSDKSLLIARISNLNMWSEVLSGEEIVHMSYGCNMYRLGTLLSWQKVIDVTKGHLIRQATCLGMSSK